MLVTTFGKAFIRDDKKDRSCLHIDSDKWIFVCKDICIITDDKCRSVNVNFVSMPEMNKLISFQKLENKYL